MPSGPPQYQIVLIILFQLIFYSFLPTYLFHSALCHSLFQCVYSRFCSNTPAHCTCVRVCLHGGAHVCVFMCVCVRVCPFFMSFSAYHLGGKWLEYITTATTHNNQWSACCYGASSSPAQLANWALGQQSQTSFMSLSNPFILSHLHLSFVVG